jgi:dihydroorotate dehydrogenase
MNWFPIAKIFLHALAPEKAHNLTIEALKRNWVPVAPVREYDSLSTTLWDLHFPNPIGLAAGFDKNAEVIDPVSLHGFGFIEVGSVTPLPQSGNDKPRLFRLPADRAVINRMGFNNHGADIFCANLESKTSRCIVGANIGKNKTSVDAIADYLSLLKRVYPVADYIVVNISSPNTEGLRKLQ